MKLGILFIFVLLSFLCSCNNSTVKSWSLKPTNFTSSFISIAADSAYVFKTPKGEIVRIEKNSINVSGSARVQLEIKEAYTMQEILLAGLA